MSQENEQKLYNGDIVRLDRYLKDRYSHISRKNLIAIIKEGLISVNGQTAQKGQTIKAGDRIQLPEDFDPNEQEIFPNPQLNVRIVQEEPDFLVVDKGAGIPCHMHSIKDQNTLVNFLLPDYPELANIGESRFIAGIAHRLDNDTSGLVLVARNEHTYSFFRSEFQEQKVKKEYQALVYGELKQDGIIDAPLMHHPKNRRKMVFASHYPPKKQKPLSAHTKYEVIQKGKRFTWLKVWIQTGVTHQIRVHLAQIGHPLVGDYLYASQILSPTESTRLPHHLLHACRLTFRNPRNQEYIECISPVPSCFQSVFE